MKVFSVLVVCFMVLPHGVKSWLYTSSPQAGWSPTVGNSHNGDSKTTPFMLPKEHQYLPKLFEESSRTKKSFSIPLCTVLLTHLL